MRGTRVGVSLRGAGVGIIPAYAGNTRSVSKPDTRDEGSSPRMRGTRLRSPHSRRRIGIIPAYAGNTLDGAGERPRFRDHPRVCGEHPARTDAANLPDGSSPRMRGTLDVWLKPVDFQGIIPAYAGNTSIQLIVCFPPWDHPRVCGEHGGVAELLLCVEGSSPRMRGTHTSGNPAFCSRGIIPAYAGNTRSPTTWPKTCRDHPRVCGEHKYGPKTLPAGTGSSPRMRGTPIRASARHRRPGIIPAYAGNTTGNLKKSISAGDHPRVCGEHRTRPLHVRTEQGSSPRMRGTPLPDTSSCVRTGIIPAYAGNTNTVYRYDCRYRDHPRVCGEHRKAHARSAVQGGSSPRMRGTH